MKDNSYVILLYYCTHSYIYVMISKNYLVSIFHKSHIFWKTSNYLWIKSSHEMLKKISDFFKYESFLCKIFSSILFSTLSLIWHLLQLQKVSPDCLYLNLGILYAKRQKNSRIRYLQFFFFFFSLFLCRPVPFSSVRGLYLHIEHRRA